MSNQAFLKAKQSTGWVGQVSLWFAFGAAGILALMMYITCLDVVGRYFFNRPITGSVEIISCLMGMMVFLGIGLTTIEDGHIRVDVLTQTLPSRVQRMLDVVVHILSVGIAGLMSWRLLLVALDQTADMNTTQVLNLPIWAVALVMAVSSSMLVIGLIYFLVRSLTSVMRKGTESV